MGSKQSFWKGIRTRIDGLREKIFSFGPVKFLQRVMLEMSQDDGTNMAAGVAYYAFLSLFPLLLGIISLLGLFLSSASVQDQIFRFFQENLPWVTEFLENNIRGIIQARGTLGIIGILGLLWTGSSLLSAAGHAINRAWDVDRELPFYLKKPRDLGLTLGLGILFFLSLSTGIIFTFIPVGDIPVIGNALVQVILRFVSFLLAFVIFLVLFKIMPNTRTYWRHIWFGALVTAVLFELGRILFFFYVNNFANYELVYGSIGSIIALLVWIYYSSIIIILGAEFAAEYSRMRRGIVRGAHSHTTAQP